MEQRLEENPYMGDKKSRRVRKICHIVKNCKVRCHGLDAISGGVAPDLRAMDEGIDGDEWFMERIRGGAVRKMEMFICLHLKVY